MRLKTRTFHKPHSANRAGRPTQVRTLETTQLIMTASEGPGLLSFGAAVPSASLFPVRKIKSIMSQILRKNPDLLGSYDFAPGIAGLRNEVARRAIRWGCSFAPADIVITNGCVEAVGLALRATTKPGDVVAIESPAYYGFLNLLEILGLRALEIPCDPINGVDLSELERAFSSYNIKACLFSTTVSNPTGATMPIQAKRDLVRLLARRDVPLIEDATFADLQFDGDMIAARSFDKSGNVILCASLAKTVAPGLRIGWIESKKHADRISFLKRVSSIGQPQISQLALAEYMSSGGYERHLKQLARILRKQIDRNLAMISERLPPEVKVVRPTGGFLLWLELPKRVDSLELHKRALDFKIGLAPGSIFSAQGRFKNYLRINCGQIPTPDIESAYIRLGNLIESLN